MTAEGQTHLPPAHRWAASQRQALHAQFTQGVSALLERPGQRPPSRAKGNEPGRGFLRFHNRGSNIMDICLFSYPGLSFTWQIITGCL